jgi:hypothetical protein
MNEFLLIAQVAAKVLLNAAPVIAPMALFVVVCKAFKLI